MGNWQRFPLDYFLSDVANLVDVEWLRDYPVGVYRVSRFDANRVGPTTDNGDWHRLRTFANGGHQFPARHLGHTDVGEDCVNLTTVLIVKGEGNFAALG